MTDGRTIQAWHGVFPEYRIVMHLIEMRMIKREHLIVLTEVCMLWA